MNQKPEQHSEPEDTWVFIEKPGSDLTRPELWEVVNKLRLMGKTVYVSTVLEIGVN